MEIASPNKNRVCGNFQTSNSSNSLNCIFCDQDSFAIWKSRVLTRIGYAVTSNLKLFKLFKLYILRSGFFRDMEIAIPTRIGYVLTSKPQTLQTFYFAIRILSRYGNRDPNKNRVCANFQTPNPLNPLNCLFCDQVSFAI